MVSLASGTWPPATSAAGQMLGLIKNHRLDRTWLWGHRDSQGRIDAVIAILPQPGRTGLCLISAPETANIAIHGRLIRHAWNQIPAQDLTMAQALLEEPHRHAHKAFAEGGFHCLATLVYLQKTIAPTPSPAPFAAPFQIETWTPNLRPAFLQALDHSYIDTRDCPDLCGRRSTEDALASHLGVGRFKPNLWLLLREAGRPAGVILINPLPQSDAAELVYLGLAPEARRRGLGTLLLLHGIHRTAAAGIGRLLLAADADNAPALRLYTTHDFLRIDRKQAWIRVRA